MKFLCALGVFLLIPCTTSAEIIPGQAISWTTFSYITTIALSSDFVYFGTTEGILRYQRYERKWYDPITVSDGLPGHEVRRLAVSFDDQFITAETEDGLYSWSDLSNRWYLETDFPSQDSRDSRPRPPLPIMMMPFGYSMSAEGYFSDNQFRDWQITGLIDDQSGTVFIGTWGLGPAKADDRSLMVELMPYGLLQKRTDVIYKDGDSLWLAGNAGHSSPSYPNARAGITLFERSQQRFTFWEPRYIPAFGSDVIYDIAGDDKNIYFAGQFGLTIRPRKDDRFFTLGRGDGLPDKEVTALAVGKDSVWVGTAHGLGLYMPSTNSAVTVGKKVLGELFITALQLAPGRLIIGTTLGAYYIDFATKTIGRMKDPEGILRGLVRHIFLYKNELYVSSDWGLTSVDLSTEKASPVPYIDLPDGVYAAAAGDKYIAAALGDGLLLIDRATGKRRKFTEEDGLLSIKINAIVPDGNYLWLGSEEGLTRFKWINPDRVD